MQQSQIEDNKDLDEEKLEEIAAENEQTMTGLIQLTRKIITLADTEVTDRVIVQQDLISQIFKEFLFASYFAALETGGVQIKLNQDTQRKSKKSTAKKTGKSREEAYQLLN